jgi:hypothetical protein
VIKTVLEESSEWKKPGPGDEVALAYSVRVKGAPEPVAASPPGAPAVFDLSAGAPLGLEGLAVAVKTMKRGERARLALRPAYGYSDAGAEGVPPGSELEVDVTLEAIHEVGGAGAVLLVGFGGGGVAAVGALGAVGAVAAVASGNTTP